MYKYLLFLVLISISQYLVAEEEKTGTPDQKPEYTQEQLDKLKAAEEQFKDNPEMMNFINKIKEQSGLNKPPATAETAPQKPAIQGSRSVADDAYESGDYETAFKHYEALAAEGDPEASMILGTMYEQGQGTEKDPAAAHAWYKKAVDADPEDERSQELMNLIDNEVLSDDDKVKAEEKYEEINKQQAAASGNEGMDYADPGYQVIINRDALQRKGVKYVYTQEERTVKISPEKYQPQHQHLQAGSEHYQPQKYQRPLPSAIEIINQ